MATRHGELPTSGLGELRRWLPVNIRVANTLDRQVNHEMPGASGLYDPRWEHDACGIGAVVNICGRRDHAIVEQGKQILLNLMHRGAAGADESTGDGAGMLLQIPDEFFRTETERDGWGRYIKEFVLRAAIWTSSLNADRPATARAVENGTR